MKKPTHKPIHTPNPNQLETVAFSKMHPIMFDMSEQGTGKTGAHLVAFAERRRNGGGKALVLSLKSLLYTAWMSDTDKFTPDMVCIEAYASNRQQAFSHAAHPNADILVVNHDGVKAAGELPGSYWDSFDTLIIDESDYFAHMTSQRSKALAKLVYRFTYKANLSATSTANGVLNIWHPMFLLDGGARLGKNFYRFREAICTPEPIGRTGLMKWNQKDNAEAIVSALLKDITIRHELKNVPGNHEYPVPFKMSSHHRDVYEKMKRDCLLELKGDKVVTAVNAAVLYSKLLQVASGAVYNTDGSYTILDTDRYELIGDITDSRPHTVTFFNWQHQKDMISKEYTKRKIKHAIIDGTTSDKMRRQVVEAFQAGELRNVLAHPQSAGYGLTLTRGKASIFASPTQNLAHYLQAKRRIHRIGQESETETLNLVAEGTLEEKVVARRVEKGDSMEKFQEFLT